MRPLKVVAYLRVSTEVQAEKGLGLEVQEGSVRAWARAHGHKLAGVERDDGISGSLQPAQRPGLAKALGAVQQHRADGLVVARLDRLARALTVQEAVLARVWEANGHVFTADAGEVLRDDPADPMRTAMRQMVGVFAQLERGMIIARMRAGRELKAARGDYAYGAPPFGSRAEGKALVEVPAERETLARITELKTAGASLREIATVLDAEGRPPKRGGSWHPETINRAIARAETVR